MFILYHAINVPIRIRKKFTIIGNAFLDALKIDSGDERDRIVNIPVFDITKNLDDVFDMPLCPVCDQPIDDESGLAIGKCKVEGWPDALALIHVWCRQ